MDCSLPGSSVHGIFQARVLEWGAIAFTKKLLGAIQIQQYCHLERSPSGIRGCAALRSGCPVVEKLASSCARHQTRRYPVGPSPPKSPHSPPFLPVHSISIFCPSSLLPVLPPDFWAFLPLFTTFRTFTHFYLSESTYIDSAYSCPTGAPSSEEVSRRSLFMGSLSTWLTWLGSSTDASYISIPPWPSGASLNYKILSWRAWQVANWDHFQKDSLCTEPSKRVSLH